MVGKTVSSSYLAETMCHPEPEDWTTMRDIPVIIVTYDCTEDSKESVQDLAQQNDTKHLLCPPRLTVLENPWQTTGTPFGNNMFNIIPKL